MRDEILHAGLAHHRWERLLLEMPQEESWRLEEMTTRTVQICDTCTYRIAGDRCDCCGKDTCPSCMKYLTLRMSYRDESPPDNIGMGIASTASGAPHIVLTPTLGTIGKGIPPKPRIQSIVHANGSIPRRVADEESMPGKRLSDGALSFQYCKRCYSQLIKVNNESEKLFTEDFMRALTEKINQHMKERFFIDKL
jgi:hypothetical protein